MDGTQSYGAHKGLLGDTQRVEGRETGKVYTAMAIQVMGQGKQTKSIVAHRERERERERERDYC